MTKSDSCVTVHLVASLDGFIARNDGRVDWLETHDTYPAGESLGPDEIEAYLQSIDCYVMGARTYEVALRFESQGQGWAYGDKPTFVLSNQVLPRTRSSVQFYQGDLGQLLTNQLRPKHQSIWIVGGRTVAGEAVRRRLVDEVRISVAPVLIGEGLTLFDQLGRDVALHLAEVKAFKDGIVALRYQVRG